MSRTTLIWVLPLACLATAQLESAEFRMDTQVYVGKSETPAYETVTLFQRRIVYDFLGAGDGEITIYDPHLRRFVLLDPQRQVKTEIDEDVLLQFVAEVKLRAARSGGPTVREAASPQFRIAYDGRAKELSLQGNRLSYVAAAGDAKFPNVEAARDYFHFIDMYTRLNATRKGALPPQARLELNQALAEHDMFPETIRRTLKSGNPLLGKSNVARSHHRIAWRLVRDDQDLIDRAAKYRAEFKGVDFGEYRQLDAPAQ